MPHQGASLALAGQGVTERLLIVKTSSLGDVVHMLPAVSDIQQARPGMRIDWLVEENFTAIPALHPAVSRVIPVALRRWRRTLLQPQVWREFAAFRAMLGQERYACILDSQGLLKSALLCRLAQGVRHGPDRASAREPLAAWFYESTISVPRNRHAVERNRELAARALGYPVPTGPPDFGITTAAPPAPGLTNDYVVCLHGASHTSKCWPQKNWVALIQALAQDNLTAALPWGSPAERMTAEAIAGVSRALVLPRLEIYEMTGVLAAARAVIGMDTGLSHLAAALGRPTVALYINTSPRLTGVMGSTPGRMVNLGDKGAAPAVTEVLKVVRRLLNLGL
ncbi:MAG: lipopolysaccharide heptosyltransferase I [Candidatus Competibacteraceae bacterium]